MLRASANAVARRGVWFTQNCLSTKSPAAREVQSARFHTEDFSVFALHTCCLKSWFAVVGDSSPHKTISELALMLQILRRTGRAGSGPSERHQGFPANMRAGVALPIPTSSGVRPYRSKILSKGPARPGYCNRLDLQEPPSAGPVIGSPSLQRWEASLEIGIPIPRPQIFRTFLQRNKRASFTPGINLHTPDALITRVVL